jgi:radical SAM/Cys-rich protein
MAGEADRVDVDMESSMPTSAAPEFDRYLETEGLPSLTRRSVRTLQINVGKLCNQACHHCHVEAGPGRKEIMTAETADRILALLEASPGIDAVDITGGAPELNPSFRRLVTTARGLDREVLVRSNLTVHLQPEQHDTIPFFVANDVKVIASLPCYTAANVDKQRGGGVFRESIEVLRRLNAAGYSDPRTGLQLDLVYNPLGASLPPPQEALERDYHERLAADFGIRFNRLYTITNMPIKRFAEMLERESKTAAYYGLLVHNFNRATLADVMCRDLVSVAWDGRLYDCDFNQMLDLDLDDDVPHRSVFDLDSFDTLQPTSHRTGPHCFGCTAGTGSSCGGALVHGALEV